MSDDAKMAAVQKLAGELTSQFGAYLRTTSGFAEIFAGVGLDNVEAAAMIIVVKKLFGTELPAWELDAMLIVFGIWLERHRAGETINEPRNSH